MNAETFDSAGRIRQPDSRWGKGNDGPAPRRITSPQLINALANKAIDASGSAPGVILNDLGVLAKAPAGQALLTAIAAARQSTGHQVTIQSANDGQIHTSRGKDLLRNAPPSWDEGTSRNVLNSNTNRSGRIYEGNPPRDQATGNWDFTGWQAYQPSLLDQQLPGGGTDSTLFFDSSHNIFKQYPNLRAIGLGHELIRALHYLTGTAASWPI